ncbi:hypothetical protein ACQUFY_23065 [Robbsia andropogonis]|uniref:hypothetical protein n=1 Tax=Robbsia andropogonis TaxID=28092 RepID=UPI003D1B6467
MDLISGNDIHPMYFNTPSLSPLRLRGAEVALALEQAEARHLQEQVETYRNLAGRDRARVVALAGGIAAFTENIFGRKLNHVTGLGMGASVSEAGIAQLERAYAINQLDVEIDLCPHADASARRILEARGYTTGALSNTYVCQPTRHDAVAYLNDAIEVIDDRNEIEKTFIKDSMAGFAEQLVPRPAILLETLARIAVARTDTLLYAARLKGVTIATAGMSILEVGADRIAHFYIASTLPTYRGQGAQLGLLHARLLTAWDVVWHSLPQGRRTSAHGMLNAPDSPLPIPKPRL